jgi:long-chain fatty acid transport protein
MKRSNAATAAVVAALVSFAGSSAAGGFAIGVQSGSATGNAVAGGAAVAEDASVVWSNPAGMTHLKQSRQLTTALHIFKPSFKFENIGSTGVFAAPGTGEGRDGGDWAYVPTAFLTTPITNDLRFGFGITAPFGLTTSYDQGWRGQLLALKSKIMTVNLNPALAYRVNDIVSVGAGVNVQWIRAELSSSTGSPVLRNIDLDADDIGYGFNLGVTVQPTTSTRIGASYRSQIKYSLDGRATFSGPGGPLVNGDVTADLRLPDSASLSAFHEIGKWELLADATWTGWDTLQQLVVTRSSTSAGGAAAGSTLATLPFQWKNTWRFAVGANYKLNEQVKIRGGVARDNTPTNDTARTPRLPDQDRTWIAAGLQYRLSRAGVLEVGYAHEFLADPRVNNSVGGAPGALVGKFKAKADILSLQYSQAF